MKWLAIVVTVLVAHGRAVLAGFVFDDRAAILANPLVRGALDPVGLLRTDFWGQPPGLGVGTWRPLPVLSFWLDWHLGGGAPWLFHLTSVLLHAGAALLLARAAGAWAGLIFAALAVNSEAVCSLVGRADVMAAGFCFMAWGARRNWVAAVAFAAALLCKESAVVWPLFLLAADLLAGRRPSARRYGGLALAAAAAIGLRALCFAAPAALAIPPDGNPLAGEPFGVRLLTAPRLLWLALRLTVAPVALTADYGVPALLPVRGPSLEIALAVAALAVVWLARRRAPLVSTGLALFLVAFAPVANVVALLPAIFAERWLYLPAAGIAVAIAGIAAHLRPALAMALIGLVVVGNVGRAAVRAGDWHDDLTLFSVEPRSARSWANYGEALLERHRDTEALNALAQAIDLLPRWGLPRTYAGLAMARLGETAVAEAELRAAVALDPDLEQAAFNLAGFLARGGRKGDAVAVLRDFLARHPGAASAAELLRQIER